MATNLDNLFAESTVESTGVGKDDTGTVTIKPAENQPVQIQTSSGSTAIQVNDDATVNLDLGVSVNEITNIWNPQNVNFAKQLMTGPAIQSALDQFSGGLQFFDFNSKALFDAKIWVEGETPNFTFVNDVTPFSYTDGEGVTIVDVDWMMVLIHWHDGLPEFHILFSSDDAGQLTGAEIKAILFGENDINNFSDAYKSQLDNAPANINNEFASKQTSITINSNNISTLQSGKMDKSGGSFTGQVDFNGQTLKITNPGSGDGCLQFKNSNAPANQREYEINPRSASYLELETNDDSNNKVSSFKIYHNGDMGIDGKYTQNGNDVLDTTKIVNNINGASGTLSDNPTLKSYIDSQSSAFNGGTITTDLILNNCDLRFSSGRFLGRYKATHSNLGTETFNFGSYIGVSFTGMRIYSVWDGTQYNEEEIAFFTHDGGISAQERARIKKDGKFGIGTSTPTEKLDVVGTIKSTGLDVNGNADVSGTLTVNGNNVIVKDSNGKIKEQLDIDTNTFPQLKLATDTNNAKTGIGIADESGAYRSGFYYDEATNRTYIVMGSNFSLENLDKEIEFDSSGNLFVKGNVDVGSWIKMKDTSGTRHNFEKRANGIGLRTEVNGSSGTDIFTVESSGGSKRLFVQHDGVTGTSNPVMVVDANSDGTGGSELMHGGNFGRQRAAAHYYDSFPSLTTTIVASWFAQGANIHFIGVGAGSIILPEIVVSNPSSSQVLAGDQIIINNWNSGSDIALVKQTSQKFMIDNVSNIITASSSPIFSSSRAILVAMDARSYSAIGAFCWALTGI